MPDLQDTLFDINAKVHKVIRNYEGPSIFPRQIRKLVFVLFQMKKPCTLKTLCAINGITTSNGSVITDKLVRSGVVRREHDQEDRRKVLISLTPEYQNILASEYQRQVEALAEAMSFLKEDEIQEFTQAALKVNSYLTRIIEEHELI